MNFPPAPRYIVERDGKILDADRGKWMKPFQNKNSRRYQIKLVVEGKRKCYYLARIVAMCYVPNPDNMNIVDHIDRNIHNNDASNLRWVNATQSTNHSIHRNRTHVKHVYQRGRRYQVLIRGHDGVLRSYGYFGSLDAAKERAVLKAQEVQGREYAYVSE